MKKSLHLVILLFCYLVNSSHVGSPGVTYEGMLGNYRVLANINPPDVIPGTATLTIILPESPNQVKIEARPIYWSAGLKGTPKADPMLPVAGEMGRFEGELWFMEPGTSSVQIILEQNGEVFETIIPVMAMPTAQRDMPQELGLILAGLGIFLVILMVTIISSAMSESIREPGEIRNKSTVRRNQVGIALGSICMLLILWAGKNWWDAEAETYSRYLFQPISASAQIETNSDGHLLTLSIDPKDLNQGRITRKLSYMVPDHGKLMHMFLIRKGDLDVFAHLHPQRIDTLNYSVSIPDLPAGDYHVFADITRYTGFSETIVADLQIPDQGSFSFVSQKEFILGRDDTYTFSTPVSDPKPLRLDEAIMICGKPGIKTDLPGGYSAIWETETGKFDAGKLYTLDFALFDSSGEPAVLEPYLGMMGHAVVLKHDGSVYIHLHPTGNYSMGSQQMLKERFASGKVGFNNLPSGLSFPDSIDNVIRILDQLSDEERDELLMADMDHQRLYGEEHEEHSMVSFPYAFPESGKYRVWIQVKINGKIVNGAFDVEVG